MNFKKVAFALTALMTVAVLTGCEEEASKTTHAVDINSTEKTVQESPKKGIDRDHTIIVQGQEIELETSYKVDERNLNDYVFTTPSIADLSVKLKNDAPQNRYKTYRERARHQMTRDLNPESPFKLNKESFFE